MHQAAKLRKSLLCLTTCSRLPFRRISEAAQLLVSGDHLSARKPRYRWTSNGFIISQLLWVQDIVDVLYYLILTRWATGMTAFFFFRIRALARSLSRSEHLSSGESGYFHVADDYSTRSRWLDNSYPFVLLFLSLSSHDHRSDGIVSWDPLEL